jgi:ABC-type branched-subunit amino acid transport system ATPase component
MRGTVVFAAATIMFGVVLASVLSKADLIAYGAIFSLGIVALSYVPLTGYAVICGLRRPSAGQVFLDGRDVTRLGPARRARHGLARTFQRLELFGRLSVRDNLLLAAELGPERRRAARAVTDILARLGLSELAGRPTRCPPGSPAWSRWAGRWRCARSSSSWTSLHGVDLSVAAGQVVALLGPNGAGKTTTLRVAAGVHPVQSGRLLLGGRDLTGVAPRDLARAGVCLIPEGRGVFPNLSVRDNLLMMTFTGHSREHIEEFAFTRFPVLAKYASRAAGTLSGGEQQMRLLARDRGGPALSHQGLLYPATDMSTPPTAAAANALIIPQPEMLAYRRHYLADADPRDPRVSPLLAEDHSRLPPALIQVGEHDPLRDDGARYAAALRAAGVPVRFTEYVGMPHGYLNFPGICRGAPQALAELCAEQTAALVQPVAARERSG